MDITSLVWIDSTGYNYEDYPSFLAFYTTGYQSIYGTDTYLGDDSQDGQWIAIQAQAAYDMAAVGAAIYNSFSPTTAQGTGLSRVVRINGISRENSSNSTVDVTLTGTAFITVTNGIAIDILQQQWALPASVTIGSGGSVTVTATAVQPGAIQAEADTITGIFTPTQGWQTVNNSGAATPGSPVETDAALRQRQTVSTAIPSLTVLEGAVGLIANTPGVTAVQPYENDTNTTDGNGAPAHCVYFVVEGGTDDAVASAIQIGKTPGVLAYGTTTVPTTDSNGVPINISFFRPSSAVISVQVTLTPLSAWTSGNETIIADAIAAYINTEIAIGGNPLDTSGDKGVSYSQLFAVAYVPGTQAAGSFIIESIELKKNSGSFAVADVDLAFDEQAVCDPSTNVSFIT